MYQPAAASAVKHVEMLGLQGAGKTTLANMAVATSSWCSVAQLERRERLPPRRRHHRVAVSVLPERLQERVLLGPSPNAKDAALFATRHRDHLDTVMRCADRVPGADVRELAVQLLFESWSEYAFVGQVGRPRDAVLHHESVLQRAAFLLALLPPDSPAAEELVAALPLPDGVVLLDLQLETAIERVRTRGREFTMTEVMPAMEQQIAGIVVRLRSEGVPVTVVDAERPPAESLPTVLAFLDDRRASAG